MKAKKKVSSIAELISELGGNHSVAQMLIITMGRDICSRMIERYNEYVVAYNDAAADFQNSHNDA